MNRLNVFKNSYYRWCYPSCWWKNIRMFFRSFKYAYQRITKGFCDMDIWDLDNYYLNIFTGTLNYLANYHMGYPDRSPYETDEKWTKHLRETADCFYRANEMNEYYPTPASNVWWAYMKDKDFTDKKDAQAQAYSKAMATEETNNALKRKKDLEQGLDNLKDCFFDLWD